MSRLAQAIGLALALALNLVPERVEAAELIDPHEHRLLELLRGADGWLQLLEDRSVELDRRVEITVSDPDFVRWLGRLLTEAPPTTTKEALATIEAAPQHTEVDRKIIEGLQSLREGTDLLPVAEAELEQQLGGFQFEPEMLDEELAQLTSPAVPELIGDELQSFAEGFVALLGAGLLEQRDPDLALQLATIFAERSSRVPRLVVLLSIWTDGEHELSPESARYVTSEDRKRLARDLVRAEQEVANLQLVAGSYNQRGADSPWPS